MPQFTVNATRFDPYKNYKFRLRWDGRFIAGVSKISPLKRATEPVAFRSGGDNSIQYLSPSTWKFDPITIERGVTQDVEFEAWANQVNTMTGDAGMALAQFRREITIQLLNEAGQVAKAYNVFRCWVSEYTALPELDANAHVVAIEKIVLQNEGWERDLAEPELPEP
ncbi:phage tail protein [Actinoplanes sp. NEAU-A12]|uniref:Phage tail protein n=1 Tax=Actinoplanes sandaracinus TaxID=3045177 RepID=A0ABT6WWI8_9ACTN|nr:phage tail protein [Actinoplanes sandaracinus]MDI6104112.1 phage tail protein [Actinoplanes sandaracinus]